MKIIAISGSWRKASVNTGILRAMQDIAPDGVAVELLDYQDFPFYNQDDNDTAIPAAVEQFGQKLVDADAVVIATPEYNYSIPGVLKNALDWLSRLPNTPFNQKPTAVLGVSPGFTGTARAQMHLRQILQYLNPKVMNKPEMLVNHCFQKFDEQGNLTDEETKRYLKRFLQALIVMAEQSN